jgi:pyrroloquinoline quinone biosynthesis protein B
VAAVVLAAGCAGTDPVHDGPRLRVLGTVQDGGFPHAACSCDRCAAARRDPSKRRYVACLALILPDGPRDAVYLIDATPDVREQLELLRDVRDEAPGRVDRAPVDGVFLTHAHIGHYLGLAMFGYEAVHTDRLPVYCTPRMGDFLRHGGPWSQLVAMGNIEIRPLRPGESVRLPYQFPSRRGHVRVTALAVPHRDEYSDTVGFVFAREDENGSKSAGALYVPDTEPWETWSPTVAEVLDAHGVKTALLDGTFYSREELPNRDLSAIGHPLMTKTMDELASPVRGGGLEVRFIHLNHSNPALDADSDAARNIRSRGFAVAREGDEWPL